MVVVVVVVVVSWLLWCHVAALDGGGSGSVFSGGVAGLEDSWNGIYGWPAERGKARPSAWWLSSPGASSGGGAGAGGAGAGAGGGNGAVFLLLTFIGAALAGRPQVCDRLRYALRPIVSHGADQLAPRCLCWRRRSPAGCVVLTRLRRTHVVTLAR